jgi:hypothetical protein
MLQDNEDTSYFEARGAFYPITDDAILEALEDEKDYDPSTSSIFRFNSRNLYNLYEINIDVLQRLN